jgi:hypothetical protein
MTLVSKPYTTEMVYNQTLKSYTTKGIFSELLYSLQVNSFHLLSTKTF